MTLDDFLEGMAARPFADGVNDCALTVADWAMVATGCEDPAGHLRGRYATPLQRERLLRQLGGLEAVMADCAARAGLQRLRDPLKVRRGDIALIRSARTAFAAICTGPRWAIQSSEGLTVTGGEVVSAWRVPHG